MKHIAIVGATSAIAEHCARIWAEEPAELLLIGRSRERIERSARDLQVRHPQREIRMLVTDFTDAVQISATVRNLCAQRKFDIVLIAHGILSDQGRCQDELSECKAALEVTGLSPVLFAEAFAGEMEKQNHGAIGIISSVAGDRGRKSNYVYGAAKSLLNTYAQGLQHRFAGSGVTVTLIKPGPTRTPMTFNFSQKWVRLAAVDLVARQIVDGIQSGASVIYTPVKWRWIMAVISRLPNFIFHRLSI